MTSLAAREKDLDFLERYASYRNFLAVEQGKKLRQQWSKKSMAESFLAAQCDVARSQLKDMFEAVGEFPAITGNKTADEKAMTAYVERVIAWDKKANK
jgi:hypothetical protein